MKHIPWEEDPEWQQARYRFLVWGVILVVVGGLLVALWSGEWDGYLMVLGGLGVILGAVCIYAGLVWTFGHLALRFWRVVRRLRHRDNDP